MLEAKFVKFRLKMHLELQLEFEVDFEAMLRPTWQQHATGGPSPWEGI